MINVPLSAINYQNKNKLPKGLRLYQRMEADYLAKVKQEEQDRFLTNKRMREYSNPSQGKYKQQNENQTMFDHLLENKYGLEDVQYVKVGVRESIMNRRQRNVPYQNSASYSPPGFKVNKKKVDQQYFPPSRLQQSQVSSSGNRSGSNESAEQVLSRVRSELRLAK